jgi:hypothetical protein
MYLSVNDSENGISARMSEEGLCVVIGRHFTYNEVVNLTLHHPIHLPLQCPSRQANPHPVRFWFQIPGSSTHTPHRCAYSVLYQIGQPQEAGLEPLARGRRYDKI